MRQHVQEWIKRNIDVAVLIIVIVGVLFGVFCGYHYKTGKLQNQCNQFIYDEYIFPTLILYPELNGSMFAFDINFSEVNFSEQNDLDTG